LQQESYVSREFRFQPGLHQELVIQSLVAIGLGLSFGLLVNSSQADDSPVTEQLLDMNRKLFETVMLDHDPTYLEANTTENYLVVGPGGVVEDREQVTRGIRAFTEVKSVTVTEENVAIHGSTAIVISRLEVKGDVQIPIPSGPRRVIRVFSAGADGRWKAISTSITPCHPRAVEAGHC
jgi:hypothetical protein